MFRRQIGTPHISDEERISGQNSPRKGRFLPVRDYQANAFWCMSGGLEHANGSPSKFQLITIGNRHVRKPGPSLRSHINLRAGARGKFLMTGNEVGMQVSFKDVAYRNTVLGGCLQIQVDISLRIDNYGLVIRRQHVRGMRKTT